jgi:outer membrane protein assembly factor BamD
MKRIILVLLTIGFLSSCSEYQKVYNGKDITAKHKLAWKYYEAKNYKKADLLFSQIDVMYKHKPSYQRLLFAHAMSLYNMEYFVSSGEKLRKFTRLYPESSKAEEASYYIVKAYNSLSPKYTTDQSYTNRAIEEVQNFVKKYPYSKYKKEINEINAQLNDKLEHKDFDIAKKYYDLDYYKSAIAALNNFLIDFPGSKYKESALYYRFKAASELALKSVFSKKEDRINQAIGYYKNFESKNPKSEYLADAKKMLKKLKKELASMQKTTVSTK